MCIWIRVTPSGMMVIIHLWVPVYNKRTYRYIRMHKPDRKKRIAKTAAGFLGSRDLCRRRTSPLVRYREEATII